MSASAVVTAQEPAPAAPMSRQRGLADRVHLTFDDGPDPDWTPAVLDALEAEGAQATFFVIAGREPQLLREIAARGHEIAYHCGTHVRHSRRARDEVRRELLSDLAWLAQAGVSARAWRTPWGDLAPWTADLAREAQLELWHWSDDSQDWAGHSAAQMLDRLEPGLAGGSVVLMHDGLGPGATRAGCDQTVELVRPLCRLTASMGLEATPLTAGGAA